MSSFYNSFSGFYLFHFIRNFLLLLFFLFAWVWLISFCPADFILDTNGFGTVTINMNCECSPKWNCIALHSYLDWQLVRGLENYAFKIQFNRFFFLVMTLLQIFCSSSAYNMCNSIVRFDCIKYISKNHSICIAL